MDGRSAAAALGVRPLASDAEIKRFVGVAKLKAAKKGSASVSQTTLL